VAEDTHEYPIMINGKLRTKITLAVDATQSTVEQTVLEDETVQKWLEGRPPRKIIIVPKRIVNVVV
jgi:leucyl-tRNA synthetase